jgi:RNA polymerase II elongation factor ELL
VKVRTQLQEVEKDKVKDTIRAQAPAKPVKRPRDDEDDSSSSGTPLSKRVKSNSKQPAAPAASAKTRPTPDTSQNSCGTPSTVLAAAAKPKTTTPLKSSPLASSPPTTASELERETTTKTVNSSGVTNGNAGTAKKRPPTDSLPGNKTKRPRPSQETLEMAARFQRFYREYEQLYKNITNEENPDPNKMTDLINMHELLSKMKTEIYAAVEAC